jgi:hypothetical protein
MFRKLMKIASVLSKMESQGSKTQKRLRFPSAKQSEETDPSGNAIQSLNDASSPKILLTESRKDS